MSQRSSCIPKSCLIPGPTGNTGTTGLPGSPGFPGPQGAPGSTGPPGPNGPSGAAGPVGPAGLPGIDGLPGPTGGTGPQGAQGANGNPGAPGPQGEDGPTGGTGPTGPTGEQGPTGGVIGLECNPFNFELIEETDRVIFQRSELLSENFTPADWVLTPDPLPAGNNVLEFSPDNTNLTIDVDNASGDAPFTLEATLQTTYLNDVVIRFSWRLFTDDAVFGYSIDGVQTFLTPLNQIDKGLTGFETVNLLLPEGAQFELFNATSSAVENSVFTIFNFGIFNSECQTLAVPYSTFRQVTLPIVGASVRLPQDQVITTSNQIVNFQTGVTVLDFTDNLWSNTNNNYTIPSTGKYFLTIFVPFEITHDDDGSVVFLLSIAGIGEINNARRLIEYTGVGVISGEYRYTTTLVLSAGTQISLRVVEVLSAIGNSITLTGITSAFSIVRQT